MIFIAAELVAISLTCVAGFVLGVAAVTVVKLMSAFLVVVAWRFTALEATDVALLVFSVLAADLTAVLLTWLIEPEAALVV
ncbi:hypothetical protein GTP10_00110 [Lactiplantibacillus plantarum]|uniref:hypothetical protein n=1 Tax=Lactiplantibacillus plantarum TaxID=1590 RepID=UPI000258B761|nr:hypothetical protein [Lactiplantibacillus plantarum]AGO09551.1 hypothetical protein Lp16_D022 [Lactiplantibacillus plantarum 16]CCG90644.1 putative membrane protein [Pediococcus pentosaceus IE-3]MBO2714574.1 hypothetical protein [Lactiplantibacillus plantarum]MBO2720214.1 hypothetical protein [Lactiplantibacillus plantarum]QGX67585.1 hypothetical protein GPK32_00855 [Lactiplantibacillus plantarum]